MKKFTTMKLVYGALFIALTFVFSRYLSITTPVLKIGFGFLPIALSSMLFGPLFGGTVATLEDIIGATLVPQGAFFPGFTLSAFLSGIIYGLFLYKKPKSILRIALASLTVTIIVNVILNTLWLTVLTGKGFLPLLGVRIYKEAIMYPINVGVIYLVYRYVGRRIERLAMQAI